MDVKWHRMFISVPECGYASVSHCSEYVGDMVHDTQARSCAT